ncbi:MAG: mannonate dehydratase [Pseudomonadota bacterium]
MTPLAPSWRWFGASDPIPLSHIAQTGARHIVTSVYDVPPGMPWSADHVSPVRDAIKAAGLTWSVVESIPVTDEIKTRSGAWRAHVDAWKTSLLAVGAAGVPVVCYNFMPVLDWTRTELNWAYPGGSQALRFDAVDCAAYDIVVLEREGADADYSDAMADRARDRAATFSDPQRQALEHAILSGLPGADRGYTRDEFRQRLAWYDEIDADALRSNLTDFMAEVVPVAAEAGILLAIHPDDPPFPLFGLPRVVSVAGDYERFIDRVPHPANGITMCTGSLGARSDNDLIAMTAAMADRVHFAHLRNVGREPDGSFYESEHLNGDVPMVDVVALLMRENARRVAAGSAPIPYRPDHGHIIGPDADGAFNPGYTFAGRLRGLGELQGLMAGLSANGAGT